MENVGVVESIEKKEQEKIVFKIAPSFVQVLKQFAKLKGKDEPICLELSEKELRIRELDGGGIALLETKISSPNFEYITPPKSPTKVSFYPKDIISLKFKKYGNLIFTILENSIEIKQEDSEIQIKINAFQGENEIRDLNITHTFKAILSVDTLKNILESLKRNDTIRITLKEYDINFSSASFDGTEINIKAPLMDGSGFLNENNKKLFEQIVFSVKALSDLIAYADKNESVELYFGESQYIPLKVIYRIDTFEIAGYLAPIVEQ